jgi:hypothetical protein
MMPDGDAQVRQLIFYAAGLVIRQSIENKIITKHK